MNTIRQLCDRCVVLDKGKVVFEGEVEEAIAIYMGTHNADEFPVSYGYRNYQRPYHFGQILFVTDFCFAGKDSAEFNVGEQIEFTVRFNSKMRINNAHLVLRIKDSVNSLKLAACLSDPFYVDIGNGQEKRFSFQLNELVEDVYCFSFEIIARDTAGNYYSYDNPGAIIPVRIINQDETDVVWSKQYWGNIRLKGLDVL
jgi:lipopolysaccharide transport system ATP-binding protein